MKYKIILLCLLTSCINNTSIDKISFSYSAKGFAKIENSSLSKLVNNSSVFHNKLKQGTKIRLINPANGKSLEDIVKKKIKYNNFYKVLISKDIAEKLDLDAAIITPDIDIIPNANTYKPAYLVFSNYEKILNWNRSLRFALAVCTLKNNFKNEI